MTARLEKRSFTLARHRTSVALEPDFWTALEGLAADLGVTLAVLVAQTDSARSPEDSLASRLRVRALRAALDRAKH
jgi:predicted DNA-binding ribbon-helix-helix protein